MIVLRHYFKIRPRTADFPLERRVEIGDDVLLFFVDPAATGRRAGSEAAARPPRPDESASALAAAPARVML